MYSLFCMSRGRRPGLQWKPSEVHNEEGEPIAGIGLFNGADAIETGEFIGFYTGHWKEKASAYTGSNDYMFALCADYPADWHVCPTRKVDEQPCYEMHLMAAINEPPPMVLYPSNSSFELPPVPSLPPSSTRMMLVACCVLLCSFLRFLQVTANAVFKRWYKGAQVSNSFRASDAIRALAVHATRRIEPFEEILAHYGQRYVRLDETGHEYKPGLPARDLPVNMCQKPADLLGNFLPVDAYSA